MEVGFVKLGNFTRSDKKRRFAYILTPQGISEKAVITANFLKCKKAEYEQLKQEIEELQREVKKPKREANRPCI